MAWEVQHYVLGDGWINNWWIIEDGIERPLTFKSEAEAQAELDEFFSDIEAEILTGERQPDEGYQDDEFRIVEIAKE